MSDARKRRYIHLLRKRERVLVDQLACVRSDNGRSQQSASRAGHQDVHEADVEGPNGLSEGAWGWQRSSISIPGYAITTLSHALRIDFPVMVFDNQSALDCTSDEV